MFSSFYNYQEDIVILVDIQVSPGIPRLWHLPRNDTELENLAQTWSEHCKYNIFCSPIDKIKDSVYANYIKRTTHEIDSKI
ncbi:unnamed protein product [Onchocerca flexuosa]|uniref:FGAR-AT_linker domain-containing protein n=1 Tax=Onchocerca flexuosa TaxID=387005 RepID=A0A183I5P0_9BILA|nr:unnamed protein product [Onchocerca flexuosa]